MSGLSVWVAGSLAHAAPVRILVDGVHDCPDHAALVTRIEGILRRPLGTLRTVGGGVQVSVRFVAGADGYSAVLRFEGEKRGERRLRDPGKTCAALAEAVSTSVALVIEGQTEPASQKDAVSLATPVPSVSVPTSAPAPSASAATSATPVPAQTPPTLTAAEKTATTDETAAFGPRSAMAATANATWKTGAGIAVGPAIGFVAGVGWRFGGRFRVNSPNRLELAIGAQYVFEPEIVMPPAAVRTSLWFASVQTCYRFGERIALVPCALYGVGMLRGEGVGYSENRVANLVWSAMGAGVWTRMAVSKSWFLVLGGGVWAPLRALTFSAQNVGMVVHVPPVAVELGLGLEMAWEAGGSER